MFRLVNEDLYEDTTFEQTSVKGGSKPSKALLKSILSRGYIKSKGSEIVGFFVYSENSKTFNVT